MRVDEEPYTGGMDLCLLPDKETIRLFYHDLRPRKEWAEEDPFDRLLESEKWYELLIIVQVGLAAHNNIIYSPCIPPNIRLELAFQEIKLSDRVVKDKKVVQGIILDLNWDATSIPYLAIAGPRIYTHHFVLVQTAIGKMVLSYPALQERLGEQVKALALGSYLEWELSRLDILAIIAKRPLNLGSDPSLTEIDEEQEWEAIVRKTHVKNALRRFAAEVLQQDAAGKTKDGGFAME